MYLPPETLKWCISACATFGVDLLSLSRSTISASSGVRQHVTTYLSLRDIARLHIQSRHLPILQQCQKPIGGVTEVGSRLDTVFSRLIHLNMDHMGGVAYIQDRDSEQGLERQPVQSTRRSQITQERHIPLE